MAHLPTARPASAVLLVLLLAAAPAAQTGDAPADDAVIGPGARALLFQAGPDLTLSGFGGATLSYKRHRTEERALRLGLTVALQAQAGNSFAGDVDATENRQFVGLGLELVPLRYRRSRTPVYLYYGVGPTVGVSVDRFEVDAEDGFGARDRTRAFYRVEAGAAGALGVEWVVAGPLSVLGEYTTSVVGTYERRAFDDGGIDRSADLFGVAVQPGARFGVSVYF